MRISLAYATPTAESRAESALSRIDNHLTWQFQFSFLVVSKPKGNDFSPPTADCLHEKRRVAGTSDAELPDRNQNIINGVRIVRVMGAGIKGDQQAIGMSGILDGVGYSSRNGQPDRFTVRDTKFIDCVAVSNFNQGRATHDKRFCSGFMVMIAPHRAWPTDHHMNIFLFRDPFFFNGFELKTAMIGKTLDGLSMDDLHDHLTRYTMEWFRRCDFISSTFWL